MCGTRSAPAAATKWLQSRGLRFGRLMVRNAMPSPTHTASRERERPEVLKAPVAHAPGSQGSFPIAVVVQIRWHARPSFAGRGALHPVAHPAGDAQRQTGDDEEMGR